MGRLTIEISESTHHDLRVLAAHRGVTIKEYVLERILPDLNALSVNQPSLAQLAVAWEERRKNFRLERGDESFRQVLHDGHKW